MLSLCSLSSRSSSCAGNPELVMLVPDVAKSKRLITDESEALKPILQFAFRRLHSLSPAWGIITLRWASHDRRYVSNCEICGGGRANCVHRSIIQTVAHLEADTEANQCAAHSLLRKLLQRRAESGQDEDVGTSGDEEAQLRAAEGDEGVHQERTTAKVWHPYARFLSGAALRFVRFAAFDPRSVLGSSVPLIVRDGQRRDEFEARAAKKAYDSQAFRSWFSSPEVFEDSMCAYVDASKRPSTSTTKRCRSVQWVCDATGSVQPCISSHLPPQCDGPLLFAAALQHAQSAEGMHGQALSNAFRSEGIQISSKELMPTVLGQANLRFTFLDHRNLPADPCCEAAKELLGLIGVADGECDNQQQCIAAELLYHARTAGSHAFANLTSAFAIMESMDHDLPNSVPSHDRWPLQSLEAVARAREMCSGEGSHTVISVAALPKAQLESEQPFDILAVGDSVIYTGGALPQAAKVLRSSGPGVMAQDEYYIAKEGAAEEETRVHRAELKK
jgi:hypothetical protein